MFNLLWQFKELIIAGVVLVALAGAAYSVKKAYSERDQFRAEVVLLKKQIYEKEKAWGQEVLKWEAQVLRQQQEVDALKKKQAQALKKERQKFDQIFKETEKVKANVKREMEAAHAGTLLGVRNVGVDVHVPASFVRWYNDTVEGSHLARFGRNSEAPYYRPEASGKILTYAAPTFAEIVIKNAQDCVDLAVRHNALVDTVLALEKANEDSGRSDRVAQASGGDLPDRVVESLF